MDVSIKPRSDAPIIFQPAKHPLDDVALFIKGFIVRIRRFSVRARGNNSVRSPPLKPVAQIFAVIPFIGQNIFGWRHRIKTGFGNFAIMHIPACQEKHARSAKPICYSVDFGVRSTFAATNSMGQGPPFAPRAQRWTLMLELSIIRRSGIPSMPERSEKIFCHTPRSAQRTKRL